MMAWEASNHDAPGRNPPCFTPLESNASETSHVVNRRRASRVVWVMDMAVLEEVVVDAVDGRRLVITVGRWMEETAQLRSRRRTRRPTVWAHIRSAGWTVPSGLKSERWSFSSFSDNRQNPKTHAE